MSELLFFTLAFLATVGAVAMISLTQPIFSALSFIVTLIALAGIYALLGSSFLFAIQIIIYAGAIISLILFIIMFLNIKAQNLPKEPQKMRSLFLSSIAVLPFSYLLILVLQSIDYTPQSIEGSIKSVGSELFKGYILPFELISILLLVSLIGAVVLAKKEPQGAQDDL